NWYDEQGKLINRHILPVLDGVGWGSFEIPSSYQGNRIHAMAYTQWMRNFDEAFCFQKDLGVIQKNGQGSVFPSLQDSETRLQFFPEGGYLVEGLESVLAFKAQLPDAMPTSATGTIVTAGGKVMASFTSLHDGMGKLLFTPLPGESYTAKWTDGKGIQHETPLPAARKSGVVFTLLDGSLDRNCIIRWTEDIASQVQKFHMVVQRNQQLLFSAHAPLTDKMVSRGSLPIGRFPSGVITVTLFTEKDQPLAERVFFVNNEEYVSEPDIQFDQLGLQKREENRYRIIMPDSIPANLSLSVTAGELPLDSSENILSGLLLSPELKGSIYHPAYYFSNASDSIRQQLDLVMLTNGWRRFRWEEALRREKSSLPYAKENAFLSLIATIRSTRGNALKKAKTVNLVFQSKDSSHFAAIVPLNDESWFEYKDISLFDTAQVFYQLNGETGKGDYQVTPTTSFLPLGKGDSLVKLSKGVLANQELSDLLQIGQVYKDDFSSGTTLQAVTVETKAKPKAKKRIDELNDSYTSGMFKGGDAYQLNLLDDKFVNPGTNLINYLQSKVAGLRFLQEGNTTTILWRGINSFNGPSSTALLINEMQVDPAQITNINMADIAYIKVFRPPFLGVPLGNGGAGAIAIYTKKGNDRMDDFEGMASFPLVGYTAIRDFYSPNYAEKQLSSSLPDNRKTLYWNPNLQTDGASNSMEVSFYNNDISHQLHLILEGVTQDGRLIHVSRRIQ
ncbi:MAG: hypothetical protein KGO92_03465, partial [Bacteroidota bacterium]|nr:hypothetical protein [Bacteroidota bacterium]